VRRFTHEARLWRQDACGFIHPLLDGDSCVMTRDGIVLDSGQPSAGTTSREYGTVVAAVSVGRAEPMVLHFPYRVWCAGVSERYAVLKSSLGDRAEGEPCYAYSILDVVDGEMKATVEQRSGVS